MPQAHRLLVIGSLMALAACGSVAGPVEGPGPLRLEGSLTSSSIGSGEATTFSFHLRNLGPDTVRLVFGSGCQVLPYVRTAVSGSPVHPRGGGYVCTAGVSTLTLGPGATKSGHLVLYAGSRPDGSVYGPALAPGSYQLVAETTSHLALRSKPVTLHVR